MEPDIHCCLNELCWKKDFKAPFKYARELTQNMFVWFCVCYVGPSVSVYIHIWMSLHTQLTKCIYSFFSLSFSTLYYSVFSEFTVLSCYLVKRETFYKASGNAVWQIIYVFVILIFKAKMRSSFPASVTCLWKFYTCV